MERDSTRRLKLDRRLIGRRGWLSEEELERELAALPDVSHKIAPAGDDPSAPSEQTETLPEESPERPTES
jgi:hypothetical protein